MSQHSDARNSVSSAVGFDDNQETSSNQLWLFDTHDTALGSDSRHENPSQIPWPLESQNTATTTAALGYHENPAQTSWLSADAANFNPCTNTQDRGYDFASWVSFFPSPQLHSVDFFLQPYTVNPPGSNSIAIPATSVPELFSPPQVVSCNTLTQDEQALFEELINSVPNPVSLFY